MATKNNSVHLYNMTQMFIPLVVADSVTDGATVSVRAPVGGKVKAVHAVIGFIALTGTVTYNVSVGGRSLGTFTFPLSGAVGDQQSLVLPVNVINTKVAKGELITVTVGGSNTVATGQTTLSVEIGV